MIGAFQNQTGVRIEEQLALNATQDRSRSIELPVCECVACGILSGTLPPAVGASTALVESVKLLGLWGENIFVPLDELLSDLRIQWYEMHTKSVNNGADQCN